MLSKTRVFSSQLMSAQVKKIDTACFLRFSKFQPTRKWVNKVNLASFLTQNLSQIRAFVISARKAKHLDVTTMSLTGETMFKSEFRKRHELWLVVFK